MQKMKEMEFHVIHHSDKEMVRRKIKKYLNDGWKKKGDIKEDIHYIEYEATIMKLQPATIYYQELSREDKAI